jgi:3-hydroxy acid dehydrogenase/malonic semialdehyde reductase
MHLFSHSLPQILRTSISLSSAPIRPGSQIPRLTPQLRRSVLDHANMSSMAQRLKGKTILITGASSGIGKSTALEFAKTQPEDLKLILTARRIDTLKEVAAEISKVAPGVKVLPVKLDVSKPEEISGFVGGLPAEFKEVDVLVNNAYVHPLFCSLSTFLRLQVQVLI